MHFKIVPKSREILKCKEFWIPFRVRSLIPHKTAGIALAMHFHLTIGDALWSKGFVLIAREKRYG